MVFPIQWNEPFGLVMIEAMACGTPVLALPGGSVEEVVRDGVSGFICNSSRRHGGPGGALALGHQAGSGAQLLPRSISRLSVWLTIILTCTRN